MGKHRIGCSRWIFFAGIALVLAAAVIFHFVPTDAGSLETGSWGLSFRTEGQTPVGNATSEQLRAYNACYVGDESQPTIYLTFDAGFENGCTAPILEALKAHNAPAAFFVVGSYIEQNPELIKRMVCEGHIVGNHTYHHWDMSKIGDRQTFAQELDSVSEAYEKVTGETMLRYYRPPQGIYSEENLQMAKEMGYKTIFWSLAYVDWLQDDQPTSEEAFSKLIPRVHNGAIVLLHSTSQTNAQILDSLLTRWEELGYRFGSLDELFADHDIGEQQIATSPTA